MENDPPKVEISFSARYSKPSLTDAHNVLGGQITGGLSGVEFILEGTQGRAILMGDAGDRVGRGLVDQLRAIISGPYYVEGVTYLGNHSFGQPR